MLQEFQISNFKFLISNLLKKYTIVGHSMEPTLKSGDSVLVSPLPYLFKSPKKNDIVAAKIDEKVIIKRISKIEKEKYFLYGDNANDSYDSRAFGKVTRDKIIGKIIFKQ